MYIKKWLWLLPVSLLFVMMSTGCSCGVVPSTCNLLDCFGECIDPRTDQNHCGACNRPCQAAQRCEGGKCVSGNKPGPSPTCKVGQALCSGRCVNLSSDSSNCGQCGLVCADSVCVNGQCSGACRPGTTACGVRCVNLQSDSSNCGSCGAVCSDGSKCLSGACEPASGCRPGLTLCGVRCVDLQTDPQSCGGCNQLCRSGVCKRGQCQSAGDCRSTGCPAGQECDKVAFKCVPMRCRSGECPAGTVCDPNTNTCVNDKCTKSGDCRNGAICVGGVCKWPQCKEDGHCLEGQRCDPKTYQCVGGCRADIDCKTGYACVNQKCEPFGSDRRNIGESCSAVSTCYKGLICLKATSTEAYCFEPCAGVRDCLSNKFRNTCVRIGSRSNGTPLQVCLRYTKKGEKCGYQGIEQAQCHPAVQPPLFCNPKTSICDTAIIQQKAGAPCSKTGDTTPPLRICDQSFGLVCDDKSGTCVTAHVAKEGEECDLTGANNAGKKILCVSGLLCFQFSPTLQRCHRECVPGQPGQCAHNKALTCVARTSSTGVCLDEQCNTDSDCYFKDHQCYITRNSSICRPKEPSGPVGFGGVCSEPKKLYGCNTDTAKGGDPKFVCLQTTPKAKGGFCSRDCTKDNLCPKWNDGAGNSISAACTTIDASANKRCLFFCNQPGLRCPRGLTCQQMGGMKFCLAP